MSAWTLVFWIVLGVIGVVVAELLTEQSDIDEYIARRRDQARNATRDT